MKQAQNFSVLLLCINSSLIEVKWMRWKNDKSERLNLKLDCYKLDKTTLCKYSKVERVLWTSVQLY